MSRDERPRRRNDKRKTTASRLDKLSLPRQRVEELEAAEAALRESEERYRSVVQDSLGLICMHDLDGVLLAVNPAAAESLGYQASEGVGKNLRMFLAPAVQHLFDEYLAHIRSHSTASGLMRLMTKSGDERIWFYRNVRYETAGKAPYVLGHALDITERLRAEEALKQTCANLESQVRMRTAELEQANARLQAEIVERKRAEETLRQAEEKYRTLVERARDAIVIVQNGHVVYGNPAAAKLSGYGWDEACDLGGDFADFIAPEDRERVATRYHNCLRDHKASGYDDEIDLLTKEGQRVTVELRPSCIEYQGQTAVMVLMHDVTARKQAEAELLKSRKIESLGVLAGGIAHDFNNLLTGILGNISLARVNAGASKQLVARLVEAEKACQRATDLTQQLLTFSKGGAPVRYAASITELIFDSVAFALAGSNVKSEIDLSPLLWAVEIDPGQINQVLHNVILNADQSMPKGGKIRVQAESVVVTAAHGLPLPEGRYVKITISDQGCGIPADHLPQIFDPYFTTKSNGSGLGLAIAHAIVSKHEGHISVTSRVGVGTTVAIFLPAAVHEVVSPSQEMPPTSLTGGEKILVMDDEPFIRELLVEMLTELDYQVVCAHDGEKALALYQQAREEERPFTAVILDVTIPGGMGGMETMARLLTLDPHVRAIVSSGYAMDPILADFRQYGFQGVVTKPYTLEELHDALKRVMPNTHT